MIQIRVKRNIFKAPLTPYMLTIMLLILMFVLLLLRFVYSEHKDWVVFDKAKDLPPQEPEQSF